MTPASVTWTKGGAGELEAIEGDKVRLRSTTPAAPGARVDGALAEGGAAIRVKVARCRLREGAEGAAVYEIEGRLIDATRDLRAELARLIAGPPAA